MKVSLGGNFCMYPRRGGVGLVGLDLAETRAARALKLSLLRRVVEGYGPHRLSPNDVSWGEEQAAKIYEWLKRHPEAEAPEGGKWAWYGQPTEGKYADLAAKKAAKVREIRAWSARLHFRAARRGQDIGEYCRVNRQPMPPPGY